MRLLPVVEGHGDVKAVPILLRNMLAHMGAHQVLLERPYRLGDYSSLVANADRHIPLIARENCRALWLLDCDDGCPAERVVELRRLATLHAVNARIEFSFFVREFETLFLASPEITRDCLGIAPNVHFPENAENIRGAKQWLSRHMPSGSAYKETIHQPILAAQLDVANLAEKSKSFLHLKMTLERLLTI